jgi:hypothetical protein
MFDNLQSASLPSANLRSAKLQGAIMIGVDLTRANLTYAPADGLVCPTCRAAEEHGPYPIATPPVIPLCDGCRCALVSVLPPLRNAG